MPGDSASSALHTHAAHAQPAFDPYRPTVQQPTNVGSSSMYPEPPLSSHHDRSAMYSPYQPISSGAPSVPQSGYQPYLVPANPPPPPAVPASLGPKDNPPNPSQAAASYRPKTSNAYDPPIPPPKSIRYPSGAPGPSRVLSPTSVAQGYAVQEARHVTQYTKPTPPSLSDRYAGQAPAPLVSQLVASTSPPRHDLHPRIVPRSSVPPGHSVGAPHSSTSHRNTLDHASPHNVLSNGSVAEDTLVNELGYPVTISGGSGTFSDRTIRPNQRGEFTERKNSLNTSLSGGPYDHSDPGVEFTRPITNNSYSREISRSPPIHTGKYQLSGHIPTVERSQSPSGSSVHSSRSSRRDLVSPPKFAGSMPPHPPAFAGPSTEPKPSVSRVSSPASIRSWKSPHVSSHDPYAPARNINSSISVRDRSMSNSSLVSSHSSVASDPYAPSRRSQNPSEASIPGLVHHTSRVPVHDIDRSHGGQTLMYPAQTHPPYAPSPSLLGSNDPLGRTSSRAPIVSFGFGGKLVICFHGSNTLNTGFDIALSSRQTTGIQLRPLHAVIPESALDHISTSFPGPLFCDPGSPTGLVRAAAATQSKSNKAKVIKYLEERAEEISRGLGYLGQGSAERRQAEGKHVLVRLLKVLLEQDGHLSGSPQVEASVRAILVPRISDASGLERSTTSPKATLYGLDGAVAPLGLSAHDSHDRVLSVQTVRSSALDKIQDLLTRGERAAAYRYALDERLWAHAMVIAGSIDKEAWKEVVNEFLRSELTSQVSADGTGLNQRDAPPPGTGREPLKVAYSLYSGQGAASVQELVPPISLTKSGDVPTLSHITPISPNALPHTTTVPIHADVLSKWPATAAMLIPGPSASECSAALVALGDCLFANQWVEAAHVCYLLAPQSNVLGTIGSPGRVVLVGSRGPTAVPNFHVDDDAIVLSEIVEFALSLAPLSKGQEPFNGLLNLQPYKLVRAVSLAEMGHVVAANRYCLAITACLSRAPAGSHLELTEQLRELSDRLIGAPLLDKTGSWIGGKMSRPSLDSFGNWLGGRLTEFVAGGNDSPTGNGDTTPHENKAFAGPFSHYSTISSSVTSKAPSPQPNVVDHDVLMDAQSKFPHRPGSAQAVRLNSQVQIDRASSAMEYRPIHRNSSPAPRIASASAATTYFSHTSLSNNGYSQASTSDGAYPQLESESQYAGFSADTWWGSSSTGEFTTTTPTAAMFPNDRPSSPSGFVSLMDRSPMSVVPASGSLSRSSTLATHDEDDDDDLGLGNSGKHKTSSNDSNMGNGALPDPTAEQTSPQLRPGMKPSQQSSGWFSRWWNKEGSSGPVKATLGEESSFVYDKELKRWVNKKAGAGAPQPAAPPPPPTRAQTTSPGHTAPRLSTSTTLAPPPARAASAIDLTASPPRRMVPRPRSTLASTEGANNINGAPPGPGSTASPPPIPSGSPTPPPSRPRSQATKRNLRSRYVDVFQQPTVEP